MRGNSKLRLIVAVGLLAGAVLSAAAPADAAPLSWSIAPSPSPFRPAAAPLSAVSCSSSTNCFAVGVRTDIDSSTPSVVTERWNGTTWSIVASPRPAGAVLNGVSCPTAARCFAVGNTAAKTLTELWNGTIWSIVASPNPAGATRVRLAGVSCSTTTSCFAVGNYYTGSKIKTLIEHWNGRAWKIIASPNPSTAVSAYLNAVSCRSTIFCVAVGAHVEKGDNKGGALTERWNGTKWTIVPTPTPKVRQLDALLSVTPLLNGVSCWTATRCFAVGYTASDALVERWDGKKWSLVGSPNPAEQYSIIELRGVSCTSSTDCSAVGVTFLPIDQREGVEKRNSVAEHWNGKAWKVVPRPSRVPVTKFYDETGELSALSGVSCPTATSCAAVGNSAMAERWDGARWTLAPLTASTSWSQLNGVTCATAMNCFAVGSAEPLLATGLNPLIEHFDGLGWTTVPSPTPGGLNAYAGLSSVSCTSTTDCFAVGGYTARSTSQPLDGAGNVLLEHWNGAKWLIVASPALPNTTHSALLSSVSCVSTTDCNAVGSYLTRTEQQGDANHLLAEHWNGTSWTTTAIPGSGSAVLNSVACTSTTNCFAVGTYYSGAALIEQWNGTSWAATTAPTPSAGSFHALYGVSCAGASDCTAVGYSVGPTTPASQKTLVEHWNGSSWTVEASPNPPPTANGLSLKAVSCASATSCIAVGIYDGAPYYSATGKPLIEQWDGANWSIDAVSVPAGTTGTDLNGVTCASASTCTTVGAQHTSDGLVTLIEQGA